VSAPRTPLALLALFLLVTGGTLLVWAPDRPGLWALLVGAAAGIGLFALAAGLPVADEPRTISDESVPTLIATAGVLLVLLGIAVGAWMVLVGLGVLAGGLVGVVRDLRAAGQASP
jgi:hypothetical protein